MKILAELFPWLFETDSSKEESTKTSYQEAMETFDDDFKVINVGGYWVAVSKYYESFIRTDTWHGICHNYKTWQTPKHVMKNCTLSDKKTAEARLNNFKTKVKFYLLSSQSEGDFLKEWKDLND